MRFASLFMIPPPTLAAPDIGVEVFQAALPAPGAAASERFRPGNQALQPPLRSSFLRARTRQQPRDNSPVAWQSPDGRVRPFQTRQIHHGSSKLPPVEFDSRHRCLRLLRTFYFPPPPPEPE